MNKMITPADCVKPTPEDEAEFNRMSVKIDSQLRTEFTDYAKTVFVRYDKLSERVIKMIISAYQEFGWLCSQDNDSWSDCRGDSGGGNFFKFAASPLFK